MNFINGQIQIEIIEIKTLHWTQKTENYDIYASEIYRLSLNIPFGFNLPQSSPI